MPEEEKKSEEHAHHEEHRHEAKEEHKESKKLPFNFKLTKWDAAGIAVLAVFVILVTIMTYAPKDNCEVARADYKCATFSDVMIENCADWGNYSCNTSVDPSLTQVEWYIQNLCALQNKYHGAGLDCTNLKSACNKISGKSVC
jgi:hypothetical protein